MESTSPGISLGNLWIIPPVLMKVVRIRNAEVHRGRCRDRDRDGAGREGRREGGEERESGINPKDLLYSYTA